MGEVPLYHDRLWKKKYGLDGFGSHHLPIIDGRGDELFGLTGLILVLPSQRLQHLYKVYSKVRTHTALGSYGRARPRGIGPP
jgi:hypothetical protein